MTKTICSDYNNGILPRAFFKIRYLQLFNKKFNNIPNYKIQLKLRNKYFNEYELYRFNFIPSFGKFKGNR